MLFRTMMSATALATAISCFAPTVRAQAPQTAVLPDSFAKSSPHLAFFATPNRKHTEIKGDLPTVLGKVTIDLKKPADVLVQFNSGLATVTPDGCPCSVRAALKLDDNDPVVIKRVNLGTIRSEVGGRYQVDRQSADGAFVFSVPAGKHEISLVVQRMDGTSEVLHGFYANIQAIPFPS